MKAKIPARVTTTDAEIDAAIARANEYDSYRPKAVSAGYDREADRIRIEFASKVEISIPRALLQGLESADRGDVANVLVDENGSALHWEDLDVDHYIPDLLDGVFGNRKWMSKLGTLGGASRSEAKQAAARKNGTKGGRPRKRQVA